VIYTSFFVPYVQVRPRDDFFRFPRHKLRVLLLEPLSPVRERGYSF
jgi:hypothetical protein